MITRQGFTIIEMLIAFSIIAILVTLGTSAYSKMNDRQVLISSGQTLESAIRDAQSRAYTGELVCGAGGCTCSDTSQALSGWLVDLRTMQIRGICTTTTQTFSPRSLAFPSGIQISPYPGSPTGYLFRNQPVGVSTGGTICISKSGLSNMYYVVNISQSGLISDRQGIVNSCAPGP
jgi:prepilin-type N-terminal cleavage/methylation domain-containing protein